MRIYIGKLEIRPEVAAKLNQKHGLTSDEVNDLIAWPAMVLAAFDDDEEHGPRWVTAVPHPAGGVLFAALDPLPPYDGELAETWDLRTAYLQVE